MIDGMPPNSRFALYFSGTDAAARHRDARALLTGAARNDHLLRARLHATIAAALVVDDAAAAVNAAAAAAHHARCAGCETSRAWSLLADCAIDLSSAGTLARRDRTAQILAIAVATSEFDLAEPAYFLHLGALAELGEIAALDAALNPSFTVLTAFPELVDARHAVAFRCLRATLDGDTVRAEELADRAHRLAQDDGDPDGLRTYMGQTAVLRWMQGRVVDLEPAFLFARQHAPHEPIWGVSLAWIWLRQGRASAARALIAALPPAAELPPDRNWLSTACILAEVACESGEVAIAQGLYEVLLPFADRLATIGLGITCWGTVSRPLALISAAVGDTDGAVGHYRDAVAAATATGARPWLAEIQWELAELLAARDGPGDRAEAIDLAAAAADTGRRLLLPGIEGAATTTLAALRRDGDCADGPESGVAPPSISVLGGFAVVGASGESARWQSRKARQLLKILVARRGAAVSRETVMHLLWPDEPPHRVANRFAVATAVVRRALDPDRTGPTEAFIDSRNDLIRLRTDKIDIDVETFLSAAREAVAAPAPTGASRQHLSEVLAAYGGDPFADEPDELWAAELRREVHTMYFAVAHMLAEQSATTADHATRADAYARILAVDPFDQRAHEGLIDALTMVGSHGKAAEARADFGSRMAELGIAAATSHSS